MRVTLKNKQSRQATDQISKGECSCARISIRMKAQLGTRAALLVRDMSIYVWPKILQTKKFCRIMENKEELATPKTNRRHRKQLCDGNVCVGQHTCSVLKTAMERTLVLAIPTSLDLIGSGQDERARKAFQKVDLFPPEKSKNCGKFFGKKKRHQRSFANFVTIKEIGAYPFKLSDASLVKALPPSSVHRQVHFLGE